MEPPHLFGPSFISLANLNLLLRPSNYAIQTSFTHAGVLTVNPGKLMPTPLCVSGDIQTQKGSPWSTHLSIQAQDVQQREQHWVYFGKQEGKKANNSKRAILSTVGYTGQTHSRLLKKSSLQSLSISRQESQESLIPDTYSPFIGS